MDTRLLKLFVNFNVTKIICSFIINNELL
uniref:Uncharacterized protein n=1 Tax=Lotus japonicus TaxID=34305 RepID=I3SI29_LOTJA|nr:unknown [Lotus japonicus]